VHRPASRNRTQVTIILLIDSSLTGDALKQPIPMDDTHRHFGNGQTETMIPGRTSYSSCLAIGRTFRTCRQ
jgi:hypothetical protein